MNLEIAGVLNPIVNIIGGKLGKEGWYCALGGKTLNGDSLNWGKEARSWGNTLGGRGKILKGSRGELNFSPDCFPAVKIMGRVGKAFSF